jgi:AraC-like DNA-binding protein
MTPLYDAQGYSVPASYADQLAQLVRRWNVLPEELFSGVGLTEAEVQAPGGRIALSTYASLLERARTLTGEPGLGFYIGLQKRISGYGYLGFAAMSASSLAEALDLITRLSPVLTTSITLRLRIEGRVASLVVDEHVDMGSVRDIALIGLISGMRPIAQMVTGRDVPSVFVDLAIPEPSYFSRFKHLLPNARFGQPVNQIGLDVAMLDLPLVQADRAALRLAREQCERTLDTLGREGDFVERVRRAIWNGDGQGVRSFDDVAENLAISARTLRRMLAAHGLSFSTLLDQERRDKATSLLQSSRTTLDEVADCLGYSTLSNFVRAFHRWTGMTPSAYRRSRRRVEVLPHAFR